MCEKCGVEAQACEHAAMCGMCAAKQRICAVCQKPATCKGSCLEGKPVLPGTGKCGRCREEIPSSSYALCSTCSKRNSECEGCGHPLTSVKQDETCDGAVHRNHDCPPVGAAKACSECKGVCGCIHRQICGECAKKKSACEFCLKPAKKQDEKCAGQCHYGCRMASNRTCVDCKARIDAHAKRCPDCAKKKGICHTCEKSTGVKPEFDFSKMPGHSKGAEVPVSKLLKNVRVFAIEHPADCKTCADQLRPLGVMELEEGRAWIAASEKDLEALLKRRKLSGKPDDVALAVAQLIQELWTPIHGGLNPDAVEKVKIEDGKAAFEYKKGHAYWKLVVSLAKDGTFEGLAVEDTGRRCK
jgi:hypothetical protein